MSANQPTPEPAGGRTLARLGFIARLGVKRLALLGVFTLLLASSGSLWGFYLTTHQPVTKLLPPARSVFAATVQPRYLFSINGIVEPYGVAVTPEGDRIYVVEGMGQKMIRIFDRDGKQLSAFAAPGTQETGRQPLYIAIDSSGLVYVTDRLRSTIDVFDGGGNYRSSIASPFPEQWFPLGVQVDGDTLLVTEVTKGKHRVLRLSKDGKLLSQFGVEGQDPGQLEWPQAVVADARGRIFVSDGNNSRLQAFDKAGNLLFALPDLSLPRGVEVDDYQRLHVVDTIGQQVSVYDVSKDQVDLLFSFGGVGVGDGEFNFPNCVAIDDSDRVYVSDRLNNRVQVWVY